MGKVVGYVAQAAGIAAMIVGGPWGWALFGLSVALSIGSAALAPKSKKSDFSLAQSAREITVTVRSAVEPRRIVYGKAKIAGPLAFADTATNNGFLQLHLVIPLAGHKVEAIEEVYLNDAIAYINPNTGMAFYRAASSGDGGGDATHGIGMFSLYKHLGEDDQAADTALIAADSKWTNAHRLRGVAYLYVRLREGPTIWTTGIPNVAAIVRGRRLYDPRASTVSITAVSVANPGVFTTGAAHNLSVGDRIFIDGLAGTIPTIAKEFQVGSVPSSTSFTVLGNEGSGSLGESLAVTTGLASAGGTLSKMLWSDNAALCVLDYLLSPFGFNCDLGEIDAASFIAAANLGDEMVALTETGDSFSVQDAATDKLERAGLTVPIRRGDRVHVSSTGTLPTGLAAATDYYYIDEHPVVSNTAGATAGRAQQFVFKLATSLANARAGTAIDITGSGTGTHTITRKAQPRYTANDVISTERAPSEAMRDLLSSCGGLMVYTQGTFKLWAAASGTATVTLDEDDLRGEISLRTKTERKDLFNTVRGTFVDPDDSYQAKDFPLITAAALKTADGGEEIARDIELAFENDVTRAQRLAKITLLRARTGGEVLQFPAKLTALRVAPLDTVYVSIAKLGYSSVPFLVSDWRFSEDFGIDLTLSRVAAADYAWTASEAATATSPATLSLVDASYTPAPGIVLSEDTVATTAGDTVARLIVTITAPSGSSISGYEVEYKLSTASLYTLLGAGTSLIHIVTGVTIGATYNVRARAINSLGSYSDYASASRTIDGPPAGGTNWDSLVGNWDALAGNWDAL